MRIRSILAALSLAGSLAAQSFIQMSDPQFGMYAKDAGFEHETANFEFAIATANRLKPAFVVVTGDLINKAGSGAQMAEYKRIVAKLDPQIKLYSVPGNHDVSNEPNAESLAWYRRQLGPDYYTFRIGSMAGFVVNSSLWKAPGVADEAAKMEAWLRSELAKATRDGIKHLIVFQHIPPFLKDVDEADAYENTPKEARQRYLKLLHEFGVKQLFAGHYHAPLEAHDGDLEIVITGPVGMPLRGGKSGLCVANVTDSGITHKYFDFGELPQGLP